METFILTEVQDPLDPAGERRISGSMKPPPGQGRYYIRRRPYLYQRTQPVGSKPGCSPVLDNPHASSSRLRISCRHTLAGFGCFRADSALESRCIGAVYHHLAWCRLHPRSAYSTDGDDNGYRQGLGIDLGRWFLICFHGQVVSQTCMELARDQNPSKAARSISPSSLLDGRR